MAERTMVEKVLNAPVIRHLLIVVFCSIALFLVFFALFLAQLTEWMSGTLIGRQFRNFYAYHGSDYKGVD